MPQDHGVTVLQTHLFNRLDHLAVKRVGNVGNHQTDRQGPPRAQAPGHIARVITQVIDRLQHALACFQRNRAGAVIDDVRDGGRRHAGAPGDIVTRHPYLKGCIASGSAVREQGHFSLSAMGESTDKRQPLSSQLLLLRRRVASVSPCLSRSHFAVNARLSVKIKLPEKSSTGIHAYRCRGEPTSNGQAGALALNRSYLCIGADYSSPRCATIQPKQKWSVISCCCARVTSASCRPGFTVTCFWRNGRC